MAYGETMTVAEFNKVKRAPSLTYHYFILCLHGQSIYRELSHHPTDALSSWLAALLNSLTIYFFSGALFSTLYYPLS